MKGPIGKPRGRWENNIKTGLKEIGWEGVDWIHLAQVWTSGGRTVMNTVMDSINGREFLD
jgi:hypothetical protein